MSETVFGTVFGLAAHGRLPTLTEVVGIAILTAGVVVAIGAFSQNKIAGDESN